MEKWNLKQVSKPKFFQLNSAPQWSREEGASEANTRLLDWERRSDLRGVTLRNSWFEDPPYIVYVRENLRSKCVLKLTIK